MAFLTVNKGKVTNRRNSAKSKKTDYPQRATGMVYLIKMVLDCGTVIVKIGITTRKSIVERLAENVIGFFNSYRYIPRTTVKKHSRTPYYMEVESHLHKVYDADRYVFDKKFGGSTEYFFLKDEKEMITHYEKVMKDPLDYIEPKEKTTAKQEANAAAVMDEESSMNDIDPVMI